MSEELNNEYIYSEALENAEAPNPLPEGVYPFEIRSAELKASKSNPNPKVKVLHLGLYISPDSYPADFTDGSPEGLIIPHYVVADDSVAGRFRMRKFLESVGAPAKGNKIDFNILMGVTGTAKTNSQEREGIKYATIERIIAA